MSLLIKGMEMPTNCAACRIGYRDTGWDNEDNEHELVFCPIIQQGSLIADANVKRHQLCPLVPVPPHGKLFDADAILQEATKGEEPFDWIDKNELLRLFFDAPTIIPADEGNDG